ncbi:MAG: hypothetical protein IJ623_03610 [Bacteroidales bacterium]|nr:hypothetical protein [Bacteroidales bacterium]
MKLLICSTFHRSPTLRATSSGIWERARRSIEGDTFTFKLDQALADNGGIFLIIEATEGQSNGVTRAHAKASGIKLVEEPTDAAIDIRADYVAKYGAPSAAAPKIFFRYYYVNSSTGEKSGTMLAEVKWAAAAAGGGEP